MCQQDRCCHMWQVYLLPFSLGLDRQDSMGCSLSFTFLQPASSSCSLQSGKLCELPSQDHCLACLAILVAHGLVQLQSNANDAQPSFVLDLRALLLGHATAGMHAYSSQVGFLLHEISARPWCSLRGNGSAAFGHQLRQLEIL